MASSQPTIDFHLLGKVDFDRFLKVQERLVFESFRRDNASIVALLCEHPALITIGRQGSRGHVHLTSQELTSRQIPLRWISRGGGCVVHGPGQLAVYPIVPLSSFGWSVGQYMQHLHAATMGTLRELGFRGQQYPGHFGVWGRTGQLAACGVAVRHEVTCHGVFLNVNTAMDVVRRVDIPLSHSMARHGHRSMSCLLAEHGRPVKMTKVRTVIVEQLASAMGCSRYHLNTGHPLLRELQVATHESAAGSL